jgi:DNA-binding LytR/AlgR family response regulator
MQPALQQQVLLHLGASRRLVVEPDEIYYLEASGHNTIVRRRGRRTLRDVRALGEMMAVLERLGFHRIHDKWAVNLHRIREIRLQRDGQDWEVVLRSPVNRILPVSRRRLRSLWRRFGE